MNTPIALSLFFILNSFIVAQPGFLSITSEPSGATIHIDGSNRGITPIDLLTLSTGRHTVSVSFEKYETESFALNIKNNEIEKKHVILRKRDDIIVKPTETEQLDVGKGKLTIITDPAGATVYIDGTTVKGQTPYTLEGVSAGIRKIEIHRQMGEPLNDNLIVKKEVQIRKNQTELIKINLNDYLKSSTVIFNTNIDPSKSSESISVFDKTYQKTKEYKIPAIQSLLVGEYDLMHKGIRKISFKVLPGKKTIIFIPVTEKFELTVVSDYPDYVSQENYLNKYYTPLPESSSNIEKNFVWNSKLTLGLSFGIPFIVGGAISTDGSGEKPHWGALLGGAACLLGMTWWGISTGIQEETIKIRLQANVDNNKVQMDALKASYVILFKKWQKEIENDNEGIKELNNEIEERNKLIPEASVRYE